MMRKAASAASPTQEVTVNEEEETIHIVIHAGIKTEKNTFCLGKEFEAEMVDTKLKVGKSTIYT